MSNRRAAWFAMHKGVDLPFDLACSKIGENKARIRVKKGDKHSEVTVTIFSEKLLTAVDKVNTSLEENTGTERTK